MKQTLKETIMVWMVIILTLALVCTIVGAPFLFITYAGIGDLQLIVCALWLTFWLSLVVTAGPKAYEKTLTHCHDVVIKKNVHTRQKKREEKLKKIFEESLKAWMPLSKRYEAEDKEYEIKVVDSHETHKSECKIELLIKISDELYETILNLPDFISASATQAIRDGIPLPKGHGRLFDEKDIVNGNYEIIGNKIYELEPIIEAESKE